jgi:hypothetical protein
MRLAGHVEWEIGEVHSGRNLQQNEVWECLLSFGAEFFSSSLLSKILKIYKPIILPVVLYECETWSFILREEHRVRV